MSRQDVTPLRFLVGPTASGKSAVALAAAERASLEILSMDSMLVYRGMDVGTAKPTREERRRVPHHLIDLVAPSEAFSVHDWLAAAGRALNEVRGRGREALFAGGTAFYLQALTRGLLDAPPADPALRASIEERVRAEGRERLHAELAEVDPPSAARIHPNDTKRLVRALEVWHQTGRPISSLQREWGWWGSEGRAPRPRRIAGLALPSEELEARIAQRTRAMLDAGWVDEARAIRERGGFSPTSIQALGYAAVLELADGRLDRASCEARVVLETRRFARRQRTWLRRFADIVWIDAGGGRAGDALAGEVLAALGLEPAQPRSA